MTKHYKTLAFSLVEMAMVLAFVGIIAGFVLSVRQTTTGKDCYTITKTQIEGIRGALERFAMTNDRFPVPAQRNLGVDSTQYGREVPVANISTNLQSVTTGANVALFGAIPFQAIGIPVANASDCWGNKFTYVVAQGLTTSAGFLNPATDGAMDIKTTKAVMQHAGAGYAIISHGADQLGAVKDNYNGNTPNWCPSSGGGVVAAHIRWENCDISNNVLISTQFNDGKDAGDTFFDDIINYRGKPWRVAAEVPPPCPDGSLFTRMPCGLAGCPVCKITENATNGSMGGQSGANILCNAEFPGYKFKTTVSILTSAGNALDLLVAPATPLGGSGVWIQKKDAANCSNWGSADAGASGARATATGSYVSGDDAPCNVARRLLCCEDL